MKTRNYLSLIAILLVFNACKKDPVTKPVHFSQTSYDVLGQYNSQGTPSNLLKDTISPDLLNFIDTLLPNNQNLPSRHPELFSSSAIGDVSITQPSDVYITYVKEDGGFSNSIAFYTYPTGKSPTTPNDIKSITYVFPNAGHLTGLQTGDKIKIGSFTSGTSIGFVLMQNAWDTTQHDLNNDAVHFCTNDALNPEVDTKLKKHAVLVNYVPENKILIGFEDTDRTKSDCDNDFNDVLFYVTVTH
jgi:hypothetical protein